MARLVRHDKNFPYQVKASNGEVFYICACGLSKNKPFYDGSHKRTQDENPNEIYVYDNENRVKISTFYPQT
ncbi:MAG: CDGSH iron-sulfur domain-containing protein [Sulfolobaceae archaeon]|jgi:Uncharacterized conserved protein